MTSSTTRSHAVARSASTGAAAAETAARGGAADGGVARGGSAAGAGAVADGGAGAGRHGAPIDAGRLGSLVRIDRILAAAHQIIVKAVLVQISGLYAPE